MKNESKTLFIPLYGKAMASRRGLVLHDEMAEKIVAEENVQVTGKSRSPWLALNMACAARKWTACARNTLPKTPAAR